MESTSTLPGKWSQASQEVLSQTLIFTKNAACGERQLHGMVSHVYGKAPLNVRDGVKFIKSDLVKFEWASLAKTI